MSRTDTLPAAVVAHARLRHDLLTRFASLADDPECLADTTDGESPLPDVLKRIVWAIRRINREEADIRDRIATLSARKKRLDEQQTLMRAMVADALVESGMGTLNDPEWTVGTTKTAPKLVVENQARIPEEYFYTITTLNKTTLDEALKLGKDVPGAHLTNGGIALTIRPKRAKQTD